MRPYFYQLSQRKSSWWVLFRLTSERRLMGSLTFNNFAVIDFNNSRSLLKTFVHCPLTCDLMISVTHHCPCPRAAFCAPEVAPLSTRVQPLHCSLTPFRDHPAEHRPSSSQRTHGYRSTRSRISWLCVSVYCISILYQYTVLRFQTNQFVKNTNQAFLHSYVLQHQCWIYFHSNILLSMSSRF